MGGTVWYDVSLDGYLITAVLISSIPFDPCLVLTEAETIEVEHGKRPLRNGT